MRIDDLQGVGFGRTRGFETTFLYCRNLVEDSSRWKSFFDSHASAHRETGRRLVNDWRAVREPNNVFFHFEIDSIEAARRFIENPAAAEPGSESGVLDGEYYFLEASRLY